MRKLQRAGSALLAMVVMALIGRALNANQLTANSSAPAKPLGTFILGPVNSLDCPTGFTCNNFTVTCPGISEDATGVIADQKPAGPIKAVAMFFSGSTGTDWWSGTSTEVPPFFQSLLDDGFELVQVKWTISWLEAPFGIQYGQELLASRPATAIKWVHDNMYAPLGLNPTLGQCGFCITGNSGGACQVTYAISSYGIDNIVDATIPTSGPPMASIQKGCLQIPGYAYALDNEEVIDLSYGSRPEAGGGPCVAHNPLFTNTWIANSVETGGTNYNYPATRIHIIVGGMDDPMILNHADDYFQVLVQAQQPMLTWQLVPTMGHAIKDSVDGLAVLFTALTGSTPPTPTPSPSPTLTPTPVITISASPTSIHEGGTATYTVTASIPNPTANITVSYSMGGKAVLGQHYTLSGPSGQMIIPAGAVSATVPTTAVVTGLTKGSEKATMILQKSSDYKLKSPKKASVKIINTYP